MNRVQRVMVGALLALAASARAADTTANAARSAVANATPAAPAAVPPGKVLFDRHCAFCHAAGAGNAGTMRLTEARVSRRRCSRNARIWIRPTSSWSCARAWSRCRPGARPNSMMRLCSRSSPT